MFTLLIVLHIIICFLLVVTVLLQQGKGAEIGAVFGSSEALFGSSGPVTFLNKITTVLAALFMVSSLALTYVGAHRGSGSIMQGVVKTAPARVSTKAAPREPAAAVPPATAEEKTKSDKAPIQEGAAGGQTHSASAGNATN